MDSSEYSEQPDAITDIKDPADRAVAAAVGVGAVAARLVNHTASSLAEGFIGAADRKTRLEEVVVQTEELGQWFNLPEHFEPAGEIGELIETGHAVMTKLIGLARLAAEMTHKSEPLDRAQPAGAAGLALAAMAQTGLAVRQAAERCDQPVQTVTARNKLTPLEQEAENLARLVADRCRRITEPPEMELN